MRRNLSKESQMPEALAFFRGQFVPLSEANVNITTHALHYGTAVFEGSAGTGTKSRARCSSSARGSTTRGSCRDARSC